MSDWEEAGNVANDWEEEDSVSLKDNWDDEEEDAKPIPPPAKTMPEKPKKTTAKQASSKVSSKENSEEIPLSKEQEKQKNELLVRQSDLQVACDLFNSSSKPDIDVFINSISPTISSFAHSINFFYLCDSLLKFLASLLTLEDLKKLASSLNVIINEKNKQKSNKKKPAKSIPVVKVSKVQNDTTNYDEFDDYDDFM